MTKTPNAPLAGGALGNQDGSRHPSYSTPSKARQPLTAPWKPTGDGLPYGLWVCANDRELLFDRNYCALWQRSPGGPVTRADPTEFVDWVQQDHFHDDGTPWRVKRERQLAVLAAWGISN